MKNNFLIILSFFIGFNVCGQNNQDKFDVVSYNIYVDLDSLNNVLNIRSIIQINQKEGAYNLSFLFTELANINSLAINEVETKKYSFKNDTLSVKTINQDSIKLMINYTLPVDSFTTDKVIVLTRPMKWCPFVYDDLSSLTLQVEIPEGYKSYSSGIRIDHNSKDNIYGTHNTFNSGLPLIIAPKQYYSEFIKKQEGVEIDFYFHNKDTMLTNSIIYECLNTISFCTNYIGDYNRKRLTFIESPNGFYCQSLETFLLAGNGYIKYYVYPQMKFWVAHETIHQWIGSGYFNTINKNNELRQFIEESLTEYIRFQYIEDQYGKDSLTNQLRSVIKAYYKEVQGTAQDIKISDNKPTRTVYLVGPLIFHWVRLQIGDDNWNSFVGKLYKNNYGKIVEYSIFKETLKEFAQNEVIDKMESWVNTNGIPEEIEKIVNP